MSQISIISPEEFQQYLPDWIVLDVRTPAEFEKGHIPSAFNLALFSDDERIKVGTTYKQDSPENALLLGLDFVGPKMSYFIKQAREFAPNKRVIVHCWRGGKRSQSMAWLLNMAGFEVKLLDGGYKQYRKFVQKELGKPFQLVVLGGNTGSGKTIILQELEALGEQVIDLEALAHHKGSAFGSLGETNQPSIEQFENELQEKIAKLDISKKIWIENESRMIGKIFLLEAFWETMKHSPLLHLEVPFEERLEHLLTVYAQFDATALAKCFEKIDKKLGGQHLQTAIQALEKSDFKTAAAIALQYYDKTYNYGLAQSVASKIHKLTVEKLIPKDVARQVLSFYDAHEIS